MMPSKPMLLILVLFIVALSGCATQNQAPYNYDALLAAKPRSILVMPPLNDSFEVNAPYIDLSVITRPLAEKGYYVFPVAVIENFMKENGLPTTAEMNKIPLDKLYENIGADAVLYTHITDWGQKYTVLDSSTIVEMKLKLVDGRTGALLWDANAAAYDNGSTSSNGDLLGALIAAAITQIAGDIADRTPAVAKVANYQAINNKEKGLLNGPYAPPEHPQ